MADQYFQVRASIVWTNKRAYKALAVVLGTLNEVGEDFGYREDVQRAIRAARYLSKHVTVHADCDEVIDELVEGE